MVSVAIAEILGQNAQMLVAKKWKSFGKGVLMFALITLPASAINRCLRLSPRMAQRADVSHTVV